jgi:integrase
VREDDTFPAKSPLTAARAALPGAVEPAAMSMSARSRTALSLVEPAKADGALAAAVDAFLSQPDLAVTTRAKYRQTLAVLEVELATAPVTGAAIGGVLAQRCRDAAPATWNRHLATVRSFARCCQRDGLLDIDGDIVLDRRAEKHDQTRSIPLASLERPWERRDLALRERTLGRLLYETAARADEVLRLNVEDLDVAGKRARTRSKGGDTDWLFFGSAIALVSGAAPHLRALRRRGDGRQREHWTSAFAQMQARGRHRRGRGSASASRPAGLRF